MARSVHTREYDELSKLLAELRHEAGIGVRDLARRLGRYPSYVVKVESGLRRLDVIEFIQIVSALGLRPSEVMMRLEISVADVAVGQDKASP